MWVEQHNRRRIHSQMGTHLIEQDVERDAQIETRRDRLVYRPQDHQPLYIVLHLIKEPRVFNRHGSCVSNHR